MFIHCFLYWSKYAGPGNILPLGDDFNKLFMSLNISHYIPLSLFLMSFLRRSLVASECRVFHATVSIPNTILPMNIWQHFKISGMYHVFKCYNVVHLTVYDHTTVCWEDEGQCPVIMWILFVHHSVIIYSSNKMAIEIKCNLFKLVIRIRFCLATDVSRERNIWPILNSDKKIWGFWIFFLP